MTTRNARHNAQIEDLIERTFQVTDAENRIQAAARNVDMHQVNLEQWECWFNAGYYRRARAWWFEQVERAH